MEQERGGENRKAVRLKGVIFVKSIKIKKVKRICGVRGCRNTDCYSIVRGTEFGGSMIMCAECLKDALSAVKAAEKTAKEKAAENATPPKEAKK